MQIKLIEGKLLVCVIKWWRVKLGNNFTPKGSGNYKDLDKTQVKLFPNFTAHHLITHTYYQST